MILIADSGSTKTTWMEVETGNKVVTEGLNPHFTTEEQFLAACAEVRKNFPLPAFRFGKESAVGALAVTERYVNVDHFLLTLISVN